MYVSKSIAYAKLYILQMWACHYSLFISTDVTIPPAIYNLKQVRNIFDVEIG